MQVLPVKGWSERAHLVQEDTDAPNVRLEVIGVTLDDFRAEIVWCANNCGGHFCGRLQHSCNSKVSQLNHAVLHQENILRLDISMQDLPIVTVLQSQAYLREPVQDLILSEVVLRHFRLALVPRLQVLNLKRHVTTYKSQRTKTYINSQSKFSPLSIKAATTSLKNKKKKLTIGVVHDYAKLTLLRLIYLLEANNVRMIEHFKNFGLSEGRLLVFLAHLLDIDLLNDGVRLV